MSKTLILDAMGVLYKVGDDVAEVLIPFVMAKQGVGDAQTIEDAYTQASKGEITAESFWLKVGLDPLLEDEYLRGHYMTDGLLEFLSEAEHVFRSILCLSNDLSEWSIKLRKRYGLEKYISRWFISGDLHVRKPTLAIYQYLISAVGIDPSDMIFVDDRQKNLFPAQRLGISCVLFNPHGDEKQSEFPTARTLHDIIVNHV